METKQIGTVPGKPRVVRNPKGNPNLKGGSRKGVPNKNTAALKEMILQALDGAGGVGYLQERAKDPKTAAAFLGLVGKVLPMTLAGDKDNPVSAIVKIERVIVGSAD